jgi:DNA invertase Pin-like site-specific DNA recombinase
MKLGYCRVSTTDQNLDLQIDALKKAGCERIFQEKISGRVESREQLEKMLEMLRPNDKVVIWKLCRLSRKMRHLISLVDQIQGMGCDLVSLEDGIDTSTSVGRFTFHIFAALNDYFVDNLRSNTKAGLTAARARGKFGGRPKALDTSKQQMAQAMRRDTTVSIDDICNQLGVSRSTFYRYTQGES